MNIVKKWGVEKREMALKQIVDTLQILSSHGLAFLQSLRKNNNSNLFDWKRKTL